MTDQTSRAFTICKAYEQGIGHGMARDGASNPYTPETDEAKAWTIGYETGQTKRAGMFQPLQ